MIAPSSTLLEVKIPTPSILDDRRSRSHCGYKGLAQSDTFGIDEGKMMPILIEYP